MVVEMGAILTLDKGISGASINCLSAEVLVNTLELKTSELLEENGLSNSKKSLFLY